MTVELPSSACTVAPQEKSGFFSFASKAGSSAKGFFERSMKYVGAGATLNMISSRIMLPMVNSGKDWCPSLPSFVHKYASQCCKMRELVPGLTEIYNLIAFKAPIIENLTFNVAFQEILLKRIPKALLNSPDIIDSKIAKVSRVALTALLFSLMHAFPEEYGWPNCSTAKLVNTFVAGLFFGAAQEESGSSLMPILLHIGFNLQSAFLTEQLGGMAICP